MLFLTRLCMPPDVRVEYGLGMGVAASVIFPLCGMLLVKFWPIKMRKSITQSCIRKLTMTVHLEYTNIPLQRLRNIQRNIQTIQANKIHISWAVQLPVIVCVKKMMWYIVIYVLAWWSVVFDQFHETLSNICGGGKSWVNVALSPVFY